MGERISRDELMDLRRQLTGSPVFVGVIDARGLGEFPDLEIVEAGLFAHWVLLSTDGARVLRPSKLRLLTDLRASARALSDGTAQELTRRGTTPERCAGQAEAGDLDEREARAWAGVQYLSRACLEIEALRG